MRFLLDTNVLSEAARTDPDPGLARWLREQSTLDLCISVLTLGEIRKGVLLLPEGPKRERLHEWLRSELTRQFTDRILPVAKRERLHEWLRSELTRQFTDRILPVDQGVALAWGRLAAEGRASGRRLPVTDGLPLATAARHDLTFVTRNERDCGDRGVPVVNPWNG